jgi:diguanylate cyclase (GGDEF)-like protein
MPSAKRQRVSDVRKKAPPADLFWPLALLAIIALGTVVAAGLALVTEFDFAARQREQSVVENGISGRIRELEHLVTGQVVWDAAVRNLDNQFDVTWARQQIGTYFSQNDRFAASFILDAEGTPVFATLQSSQVGTAAFRPFAGAVRSLMAAVREAEARRGPLTPARAAQLMANAIQATTIADVAGKIFILSATLVQPDFGAVLPRGPHAPVVITAMPIDSAFLTSFADRFLLQHLRIHAGGQPQADAPAFVALKNAGGAIIAVLNWTPPAPGQELLGELGLPVVAILAALAAGVLLLYRRGRRMADVLVTSEAQAIHIAYHDALTGLPNRLMFFERLGHALHQISRSDERLAVLLIDLDRFKEINDTFGHHAGDELIDLAGKRMASECRGGDTFARLSGDEFAIVQRKSTPAGAAHLASRLTEAMKLPVDLQAGRVFIGCSIGVSIVQDGGIEPAEALRQADLALYRAKDFAKGQYCFFEIEMDAAIKSRRAMESDLREALAHGKLSMAYQPQINDRDGIVGVEALVRWLHPERGDIPPSFFVPIAEECGLILDLGMFTLRRAFEDSKRWAHLKVAINISAKQLRMKDFVTRLTTLVHEVGVDPRQFELEITEGILLGDDPETHESLNRLRAAGFALVLDDFGTGYSSLSYLQRYPINKIKIDRSFVANLGAEEESEAVIGAIVKLARALRLSVIAEGVETTDQVARLTATGCYDMQGFLFGKPAPAADIDALCSLRGPSHQK